MYLISTECIKIYIITNIEYQIFTKIKLKKQKNVILFVA